MQAFKETLITNRKEEMIMTNFKEKFLQTVIECEQTVALVPVTDTGKRAQALAQLAGVYADAIDLEERGYFAKTEAVEEKTEKPKTQRKKKKEEVAPVQEEQVEEPIVEEEVVESVQEEEEEITFDDDELEGTQEEEVVNEAVVEEEEEEAVTWNNATMEQYQKELAFINKVKKKFGEKAINACVNKYSQGLASDLSFITPLNIEGFYGLVREFIENAKQKKAAAGN